MHLAKVMESFLNRCGTKKKKKKMEATLSVNYELYSVLIWQMEQNNVLHDRGGRNRINLNTKDRTYLNFK